MWAIQTISPTAQCPHHQALASTWFQRQAAPPGRVCQCTDSPCPLAWQSQPLNFSSLDSLITGYVMSTNVVFSFSFWEWHRPGKKEDRDRGNHGGKFSCSFVPSSSEIWRCRISEEDIKSIYKKGQKNQCHVTKVILIEMFFFEIV